MIVLLISFLILAVCCYLQNATFTWSSRSRNSNDPSYHRYAAYCSNLVYYLTNAVVTLYIIRNSQWWALVLQGIVYTIFAGEGSVMMMKILMKREAEKRAVGASDKYAQITVEEWTTTQKLLITLGKAYADQEERRVEDALKSCAGRCVA